MKHSLLPAIMHLIIFIRVNTRHLVIHGINTVTFDAKLPRQRKHLTAKVNEVITGLDEKYLRNVLERRWI